MPFSTNVTLLNDQEVAWPAVCVRCGAVEPDSEFLFKSERISFLTILFAHWLPLGRRPKIKAPACQACVAKLKSDRRRANLVTWGVIIVACAGVVYLLTLSGLFAGSWKPYRRWVALGGVVVVTAPYLIYQLLNPPLIDATTRGKKTDYEFRDPEYARLFAELNDAEAW